MKRQPRLQYPSPHPKLPVAEFHPRKPCLMADIDYSDFELRIWADTPAGEHFTSVTKYEVDE